MLSVRTDVPVLAALGALDRASGSATRSLERLATGRRINRAADDAAGLVVSVRLRSLVDGTAVAVRNAQDGSSVVRTADGALDESGAVLQRMRDLLVQAASTGAQDAAARADTAAELTQLGSELDRIARTTSFGGIPLLDGTYSRDFQVGADAGDRLHVTIGTGPLDAAGLGLGGVGTTGGTAIAATVTPAITADQGTPRQGWVTLAGNYVDDATAAAAYGALQGTVTWNGRTFDLGSVDYTGAVTAQDHLDRLDTAVMAAWGTVHTPVVATATGLMVNGDPPGPASTTADVARLTPSYAGATGPSSSLGLVDAAIGRVSSLRAYLGAVDNRFQHTVARLGVTGEDTSASLSRIEDTDVATEVSALSRSQVLTQATTALLAQANQTAQSVLKLLG